MYRFIINHKSGKQTEFPNINRVEYMVAGMEQIVTNEEIGAHKFPTTSNLYLFANDCTSSVDSSDVSSITVFKEES